MWRDGSASGTLHYSAGGDRAREVRALALSETQLAVATSAWVAARRRAAGLWCAARWREMACGTPDSGECARALPTRCALTCIVRRHTVWGVIPSGRTHETARFADGLAVRRACRLHSVLCVPHGVPL